ncbi:NAD(P)/FAD-dependent oxidoreductase [Pelagibacterium sp.]|uniref:NAD(P)/FAD-dependent oxidoreductase n=1 Tax=Pelagibacterium sp. TaxID=1967288 RepID=UPI003BAA453A
MNAMTDTGPLGLNAQIAAGTRYESYWTATAPRYRAAVAAPLGDRVDVAVIGGGFTGLSAALALARSGANVVVLEAGMIGGGASGRNGGQCNNGTATDFASLVAGIGMERASAYYRAFDSAVDTVERIVSEEAIACDFHRTGKIKLAAKPEHYEKLMRSHDALQLGTDTDIRLVPRADLAAEVGTAGYYGGLVFARSAGMHMGKFLMGLAEAATRHGASIHQDTSVTAIKRLSGARHRITTSRGSLTADAVLVATGASMTGPFGRFRRRIVPVGSFIVVTRALPRATLDTIMPTRRMVTDSRNIGSYFRVTPDDRLLFGGRARFAMSNPLSDAKSGRILRRRMAEVFPQLAGTEIDYCWGGIVDMTADRLPRAGEHAGLFYSMGYSGHGTQMATHMGQVMAGVISGTGKTSIWCDMDWPAIPGHFGPPWFLPVVGAYFRLQDILH